MIKIPNTYEQRAFIFRMGRIAQMLSNMPISATEKVERYTEKLLAKREAGEMEAAEKYFSFLFENEEDANNEELY